MIHKLDLKGKDAGMRFAMPTRDMAADGRLNKLDWQISIYLLSQPEDWQISPSDVSEFLNVPRTSIHRAFNHLIELGYLSQNFTKGKCTYHFHAVPLPSHSGDMSPTGNTSLAGDMSLPGDRGVSLPGNTTVSPKRHDCLPQETGVSPPGNVLVSPKRHYKENELFKEVFNELSNEEPVAPVAPVEPEKLVDTDIPLYKQDTVEGAQAYCDMAAAILGNLGKRKHVGPATDKGMFRPARRES